MAQCATVEEVDPLFSGYNRWFLTQAILMFADASGDAVSIEPDAIVRKTGPRFVQTNFHQSRPQKGRDGRFLAATSMLEPRAIASRPICSATFSPPRTRRGSSPTLYSNVYDLRARTMRLYLFHDYSRAVTFSLDDELKKGAHTLDIPSLFPKNAAAEAYAAAHPPERRPQGGVVIAVALAFVCLAIGASAYGWRRGGHAFRLGLAAVAARGRDPDRAGDGRVQHGTGSIRVMDAVFHRAGDRQLGQGESGRGVVGRHDGQAGHGHCLPDSDGARHRSGLAQRNAVLDPGGRRARRGGGAALDAAAGTEEPAARRSPCRIEALRRVRADGSRPGPARCRKGTEPGHVDSRRSARLRDGSINRLAMALQSILGRPVIDETHIKGDYDLAFDWGEDRVPSVTATLRDRFGLQLTPATRNMDALIVDRIRRDPAMYLLAHAGRLTRGAPSFVRQHLANLLTIH